MAQGWDIRRVYLYLVCLITLIMSLVGAVMLINGIVDMAYPYDPFPQPISQEVQMRLDDLKMKNPDMTTAEYEQQKQKIEREVREARAIQEKNDKRNRVKNLINSSALILVSLPVFFYHWRRVQHSEKI